MERQKFWRKKEKTEWHRIVIFNEGLVGVVQQYLKKGANIYVEGQLSTRENGRMRLLVRINIQQK